MVPAGWGGLPGAGPVRLLGIEQRGLRGTIHTRRRPWDGVHRPLPRPPRPPTTAGQRLGTARPHSAKEVEAQKPPPAWGHTAGQGQGWGLNPRVSPADGPPESGLGASRRGWGLRGGRGSETEE